MAEGLARVSVRVLPQPSLGRLWKRLRGHMVLPGVIVMLPSLLTLTLADHFLDLREARPYLLRQPLQQRLKQFMTLLSVHP